MTDIRLPTLDLRDQNTRKIYETLRDLMLGKTNNRGEVTLAVSATSTTVTDPRVGADSVILMMPATNDAGAENWYIATADITNGQFVITHGNAITTRTYRYVIVG